MEVTHKEFKDVLDKKILTLVDAKMQTTVYLAILTRGHGGYLTRVPTNKRVIRIK